MGLALSQRVGTILMAVYRVHMTALGSLDRAKADQSGGLRPSAHAR
jgi:hypothetical protein